MSHRISAALCSTAGLMLLAVFGFSGCGDSTSDINKTRVTFTVTDENSGVLESVGIYVDESTTPNATTAADGTATVKLKGTQAVHFVKAGYHTYTTVKDWDGVDTWYAWTFAQPVGFGTVSFTATGLPNDSDTLAIATGSGGYRYQTVLDVGDTALSGIFTASGIQTFEASNNTVTIVPSQIDIAEANAYIGVARNVSVTEGQVTDVGTMAVVTGGKTFTVNASGGFTDSDDICAGYQILGGEVLGRFNCTTAASASLNVTVPSDINNISGLLSTLTVLSANFGATSFQVDGRFMRFHFDTAAEFSAAATSQTMALSTSGLTDSTAFPPIPLHGATNVSDLPTFQWGLSNPAVDLTEVVVYELVADPVQNFRRMVWVGEVFDDGTSVTMPAIFSGLDANTTYVYVVRAVEFSGTPEYWSEADGSRNDFVLTEIIENFFSTGATVSTF